MRNLLNDHWKTFQLGFIFTTFSPINGLFSVFSLIYYIKYTLFALLMNIREIFVLGKSTRYDIYVHRVLVSSKDTNTLII